MVRTQDAKADVVRTIHITIKEIEETLGGWDALIDRNTTYLTGRFEDALADFDRALEIAPSTAWIEDEQEKALQEVDE
ncbi:MAG: tetratricopeptide repeat protein [Cyanobacteria bacterium P01_F01_bin.150]